MMQLCESDGTMNGRFCWCLFTTTDIGGCTAVTRSRDFFLFLPLRPNGIQKRKSSPPSPMPIRKHGGVAATKTQEGFYFSRGGSNPQPLPI
jgi:hypothetical protein